MIESPRWLRLLALWIARLSAAVVVVVTAVTLVVSLLALWRHAWGVGVIGVMVAAGMFILSLDMIEIAEDKSHDY